MCNRKVYIFVKNFKYILYDIQTKQKLDTYTRSN